MMFLPPSLILTNHYALISLVKYESGSLGINGEDFDLRAKLI